jgi:hypothetical protein
MSREEPTVKVVSTVYWGDLRQGKLRRACVGLRLHGVNENRDVKIHRGLPENIEVELAEVCAFDVGGDDRADRAELLDGVVQFGGGILGMRKRHGSEHRKSPAIRIAERGKMLIKVSMPRLRLAARQAMPKDIGLHRQYLSVDALFCHRGKTIVDRLDQLRKKRPHPEPIVEMQTAGAGWWMANHRNAKVPCALFNRFKDGRRYVVGVDINRHGMIRNLRWRRRYVPTA